MCNIKTTILPLVMLITFNVFAVDKQDSNLFILSRDANETDLNSYVRVLEDTESEYSFESIFSLDSLFQFDRTGKLTHESTYWGKLKILNTKNHDVGCILSIGSNNLAELVIETHGKVSEVRKSGELVGTSEKDIPYGRKECAFKIHLTSNDTTTVYFKVRNMVHFTPKIEVRLMRSDYWFLKVRNSGMIQAGYHGLLWLLILYSFIIYTIYKDKAYLYFSLYVLCFSIYFMWFHGLIHEHVLPDFPSFNINIWVTAILIVAFYWQFMRYYLHTPKKLPKWDKLLVIMVRGSYCLFFFGILTFLITFDRPLVSSIINNVILAQLLIGIIFLVVLFRTGNMQFRLIVYGSFLFAVFTFIGIFLYHFRDNSDAILYIQAGKVFEFIVFSVGLGYRISEVDSARKVSDKLLIEQLEKNEELQKQINLRLGKTLSEQDYMLRVKNRALERTVEKLQLANNELSSYAHIISHDLKAPLRTIGTLTDWIGNDQKDNLDKNGKEHFVLLKKRVARMYRLIEGVLEYSKAGKIKEDGEYIDVRDLISSVIDSISPVENAQIELVGKFPKLEVSKTVIIQVFQNLIDNALKFMDKEIANIKISCTESNELWQFEVTDNGPGIDLQYKEKIFQIFQTVNSKDEFESSGIGLSIVKKIVESENGSIWFESELTKGTTFYFTFPKKNVA